MKFLVILIGIIGIILYLFFPAVNSERLCYEASQRQLDQISINILNQRSSKDAQCSQSVDVLFSLETCIQEATKSSSLAQYTNDTILRLVAIIRPYGKNLWNLKEEHNTTCSEFSWYLVP